MRFTFRCARPKNLNGKHFRPGQARGADDSDTVEFLAVTNCWLLSIIKTRLEPNWFAAGSEPGLH